jgi:transcriptional regulator with XRE-family HTH domain
LTLDDLAALSGVKAKTISGFENGRGLSENKIKMLAAALKISDDEILRGPAFEDQQVLRPPAASPSAAQNPGDLPPCPPQCRVRPATDPPSAILAAGLQVSGVTRYMHGLATSVGGSYAMGQPIVWLVFG